MDDAAPRKRIKQLEVMVADVIAETADTSTLILFTGNDKLEYKPGHFLTIAPQQFPALARWTQYLEDLKGKKEPPRAYSIASAPHERHLAITVKEERYESGKTKYPPLLSPVLVRRTARGQRMEITGFTGPYTLPEDIESKTDHLVHIVAGSGAVPNFSILKHALHHGMKLRHTFIYGNKSGDDIIYRDALAALARAHPDRVKLVHALSRDPEAAKHGAVQGRVDRALIAEHLGDPSSAYVFTCGPGISKHEKKAAAARGETPAPRFLESVLAALAELGVPDGQITRESYG